MLVHGGLWLAINYEPQTNQKTELVQDLFFISCLAEGGGLMVLSCRRHHCWTAATAIFRNSSPAPRGEAEPLSLKMAMAVEEEEAAGPDREVTGAVRMGG